MSWQLRLLLRIRIALEPFEQWLERRGYVRMEQPQPLPVLTKDNRLERARLRLLTGFDQLRAWAEKIRGERYKSSPQDASELGFGTDTK